MKLNYDLCFLQTKTNGWSRKSCDNRFRHDMRLICNKKKKGWKRGACRTAAEFYYRAVRKGGGLLFKPKVLSWCTKTCVKNYASPGKKLVL